MGLLKAGKRFLQKRNGTNRLCRLKESGRIAGRVGRHHDGPLSFWRTFKVRTLYQDVFPTNQDSSQEEKTDCQEL